LSSEPTQTSPTAGDSPSPTAFDYANTKVRGVNLCVQHHLPWLDQHISDAHAPASEADGSSLKCV
jgi:hypothetical protein